MFQQSGWFFGMVLGWSKSRFSVACFWLHVTFDGEGQDLWMSDDAGEGSLEFLRFFRRLFPDTPVTCMEV